jgi:hypothetical protein
MGYSIKLSNGEYWEPLNSKISPFGVVIVIIQVKTIISKNNSTTKQPRHSIASLENNP